MFAVKDMHIVATPTEGRLGCEHPPPALMTVVWVACTSARVNTAVVSGRFCCPLLAVVLQQVLISFLNVFSLTSVSNKTGWNQYFKLLSMRCFIFCHLLSLPKHFYVKEKIRQKTWIGNAVPQGLLAAFVLVSTCGTKTSRL